MCRVWAAAGVFYNLGFFYTFVFLLYICVSSYTYRVLVHKVLCKVLLKVLLKVPFKVLFKVLLKFLFKVLFKVVLKVLFKVLFTYSYIGLYIGLFYYVKVHLTKRKIAPQRHMRCHIYNVNRHMECIFIAHGLYADRQSCQPASHMSQRSIFPLSNGL